MISDYEYYGYTYMISTKLGEKKSKEFKLNLETANVIQHTFLKTQEQSFTKIIFLLKHYYHGMTNSFFLQWNNVKE